MKHMGYTHSSNKALMGGVNIGRKGNLKTHKVIVPIAG